MLVLPEIIKMQRLFRARRARVSCERGKANQEAQQAAWNAKEARERAERAARWHSSMSRLNVTRLPDSKKHQRPFSGVGGTAAQGSCQNEEEGKRRQQVLGDLSGKDAPYANAKWSLAVAYDVSSWRGGLRQRYYFGRLTSFIAYRRRRKASLRSRVEERMVKRLQAWAALLSEEKRSLACKIKAHAPAEVVGAHLRFIARTGTWERLLLDLHEILELAISEREQAVRLLSEEFLCAKPGAPRHVLRTASETQATSPIPGTRGSISPTRNTAHSHHPRKQSWATSSLMSSRELLVGGSPHYPVGSGRRTTGGRHISRNTSTAELRRLEDLRGVVDERTLRCLHPWIVSVLAGSNIQFVPSVPHKFRRKQESGTSCWAEATKQERSRFTMSSVPSWFSAERNLCESCWAMRIGDSALGGSTCQRCGQTHRRGFSQDVSKRAGDDIVGPVPWQQFSQVKEPIDLFVVHAAYACVLHPGCEKGVSIPGCGNLGWWNGGDSEEIWWRAVCGGKRVAQILHSHGFNTVGKLYAYVRGSAATFSSSMSTGRGSGSGHFTRKVRARTKRLQRLVTDDDLAVKLSSLLLRLMSAFEELRTQHRWPTISKTAVQHAVRKLQLPRAHGTAKRMSANTTASRGQTGPDDGECFHHGGKTP
eukprot:g9343.t1